MGANVDPEKTRSVEHLGTMITFELLLSSYFPGVDSQMFSQIIFSCVDFTANLARMCGWRLSRARSQLQMTVQMIFASEHLLANVTTISFVFVSGHFVHNQ